MNDGWLALDIPAQQRQIVDGQLEAMRAGNAPPHFAVVGKMLKQIRDEVSAGAALLDAGCGSAYYYEVIEFYLPRWARYTGVDFSPAMVELARERYPDLPVSLGDLRDLSMFRDHTFDIVMSGATIAHIAEWKQALWELARVTSKWLLLHRTWVHDGDTLTFTENAYGHDVLYSKLGERELLTTLDDLGFFLTEERPSGEAIPGGAVKTYLFRRG
jgi:SAM-dependent methyltransferase